MKGFISPDTASQDNYSEFFKINDWVFGEVLWMRVMYG
jgi:hypothetical protein